MNQIPQYQRNVKLDKILKNKFFSICRYNYIDYPRTTFFVTFISENISEAKPNLKI